MNHRKKRSMWRMNPEWNEYSFDATEHPIETTDGEPVLGIAYPYPSSPYLRARKDDLALMAEAPALLQALVDLHALVSGPSVTVPDNKYHLVTNAAAVIHRAAGGKP